MSKPLQISDAELIEGCMKQQGAMQRKLFDQFAGKMMSVCRRYTKDQMEAEDMLQDGFVKVFTRIHQHREGSLEGWMRRVFVNTCLTHWRGAPKSQSWNEAEAMELPNREEDGLQKLQAQELLTLISKLPEGARMIFNLFAVEGYPHTEIAGILDITEGASRAQLNRARKILQEQLKQLT